MAIKNLTENRLHSRGERLGVRGFRIGSKPILIAVFLGLLFLPNRSALAIVIYERGNDQPLVGTLVREDAEKVVIQQHLPNGQTQLREIPKARIEEITRTVSPQRLKSLTPDQPVAYLEYAEELAEKQRDPEAHEASLRLYLIAAFLQPDELGHSCLLGMIPLARSAVEERKFRAMAFLLDADHNRRVLQPTDDRHQRREVAPEMRARVLALVQAARRGMSLPVATLAQDAALKQAFEQLSGDLAYRDVLQLGREIPAAMMYKLLTMELNLTVKDQESADQEKNTSWARDAIVDSKLAIPTLTLTSITEFDPRRCVFQSGEWRSPPRP